MRHRPRAWQIAERGGTTVPQTLEHALDCLRIRIGFDKLDGMFPAFPNFAAIAEIINDLVQTGLASRVQRFDSRFFKSPSPR